MSDFKLGIVRLGRVAGKVSLILVLPCAEREGPRWDHKRRWKTAFLGEELPVVSRLNSYRAVGGAGIVELRQF